MKNENSVVYTCFCTDIIHDGHLNIINEAKKYGEVIVGVLCGSEMVKYNRFTFKTDEERVEMVKNISDVKEVTINGKTFATYSFHYLDEPYKKAFYIQVGVIEKSDCFYIIDVEFPQDNIASYSNLVKDAISSFEEIK